MQSGDYLSRIQLMLSLVAAGLTLISMTAPMSVHLPFNFQDRLAYLTSNDGSIATAIFQTSCRIGYALGLAVATLIQENVESQALRGGASNKQALAKVYRLDSGFVLAVQGPVSKSG